MTIIVTALYAEAKPIIEKYRLRKKEDALFPLYAGQDMLLIISGMTPVASAIATTYILSKNPQTDQIVNIGICGSTKEKDQPGNCYAIRKIIDTQTDKVYHLPVKHTSLTYTTIASYSQPQRKKIEKYHLVDMESSGFFSAAGKFLPSEKISLYKIVSDHLDATIPSGTFVEKLIGQNLAHFKEINAT
jgi:nucleoside phosphorylase